MSLLHLQIPLWSLSLTILCPYNSYYPSILLPIIYTKSPYPCFRPQPTYVPIAFNDTSFPITNAESLGFCHLSPFSLPSVSSLCDGDHLTIELHFLTFLHFTPPWNAHIDLFFISQNLKAGSWGLKHDPTEIFSSPLHNHLLLNPFSYNPKLLSNSSLFLLFLLLSLSTPS